MSDRHIRRSGDDYAQALISLLPKGPAWPRDPGSILVAALTGLAEYWGFVDGRAADLLERESDPRQTIELLPDWERAWGLPDPCISTPQTIADRQRMLVLWMTMLGGQSRAFFIGVAKWLGYTITITEYAPFMAGVSRCGNTGYENTLVGGVITEPRWEIGAPEMRFYWSVHVNGVALQWFRAASGQAGVDPHLRIGVPLDLECILNRWKPAQTQIVFDFSGSGTSDPLAGTP
jgi:uncharacterized protein YmfQ (DUF2313 family)